jgi:hypothetical protein
LDSREKGEPEATLSLSTPSPPLLSIITTPTDSQPAPSRHPSSPRRPYQAETEARTSPSLPPLANATRGLDHSEPRETEHLELPQYATDLSCNPMVNSTQRLRLCLPLRCPSTSSTCRHRAAQLIESAPAFPCTQTRSRVAPHMTMQGIVRGPPNHPPSPLWSSQPTRNRVGLEATRLNLRGFRPEQCTTDTTDLIK